MTKASDNAFPSILITEGTEPAAPAAGKQRLYIDSTTHKLKRTDSSGTDVTIEAAAASGSITSSGYTQTTARLLGRTTASTGAIEEITVGSGLSLSAGSLTASGGALAADGTRQTSGADYTTSSTSFGDIDGTNLSRTITTGAHSVKVTFTAFLSIGSGSNFIGIDVLVDGTGVGSNGAWVIRPNPNGFMSRTLVYMTPTLTAASHTIKLQWKVDGNTATIQRTTAPCVYLVEELPF